MRPSRIKQSKRIILLFAFCHVTDTTQTFILSFPSSHTSNDFGPIFAMYHLNIY